MIPKLFKAIGGKKAWMNAKGFYMLEIAHIGNSKLPIIRNFWIDFEKPRIKIQTKSSENNNTRVLNLDNGWTIDENKLKIWEERTVNSYRSFWTGIPTRIFHLLASNEPSLTYELNQDRIDFYIEGRFVVWMALDDYGDPMAYGRSNNYRQIHFLGQMTNYGKLRLWKEAFEPGGEWKVELVDYKLLYDMSKISFDHQQTIKK